MTGFCACDFDPPTLYKQAVHRAKREYRCDECGGRIAPGDTYGPWRTRPPASTISHTTLPASPEAQAEYERLVALPTAEALAELARMGDPWWLRDAVLRVAGERA